MAQNTVNYQDIFGDISFEDGDSSRSVLSPAAYLADLLYLKEDIGQDDALDRRPDIKEIPLNRDNTYTMVPQLEIANGIMEKYVEDLEGVTTTAETVMRYSPYPFNAPHSLPLSRSHAASTVALEYMRTCHHEFYSLFLETPESDDEVAIASQKETSARLILGLSPEEFSYIVDERLTDDGQADGSLLEMWGLHTWTNGGTTSEKLSNLHDLKTFLEYAQMSEKELREILYQNCSTDELDQLKPATVYDGNGFFINNGVFGDMALIDEQFITTEVIEEDGPGEVGTITEMGRIAGYKQTGDWLQIFEEATHKRLVIATDRVDQPDDTYDIKISAPTPDYFDRFHRFVRLKNALGWSYADTDRLLMTVCGGILDRKTIGLVAAAKHIVETCKITVEEFCTLFQPLREWGKGNSAVSEDAYFTVFNKGYNILLENIENTTGTTDGDDKVEQRLMSVLNISQDDLYLLLMHLDVISMADGKYVTAPGDILNLKTNSTKLTQLYRLVNIAAVLNVSITDLETLIGSDLLGNNVLWDELGKNDHFPLKQPVSQESGVTDFISLFTATDREVPKRGDDYTGWDTDVENYRNAMNHSTWALQILTTVRDWMKKCNLTVAQLRYILSGTADEYVNGVLPRKSVIALQGEIKETVTPLLIIDADLPILKFSSTQLKEFHAYLIAQEVITAEGLFANIDTIVGESDAEALLKLLPDFLNITEEAAAEYMDDMEALATFLNERKERQLETLYIHLINYLGYSPVTLKTMCENVLITRYDESQKVLDALVTPVLQENDTLFASQMTLLQQHLLVIAKVGLTDDEVTTLANIHVFRDHAVPTETPADPAHKPDGLRLLDANRDTDKAEYDALTSINAVVTVDGLSVGFIGKTPIVVDNPTETAPGWAFCVPAEFSSVDAACLIGNDVYLFSESSVARVPKNSQATAVVVPEKTKDLFGGHAHSLDGSADAVITAAFMKESALYLICNNEMYRYSSLGNAFVDNGYPKPVAECLVAEFNGATLPANPIMDAWYDKGADSLVFITEDNVDEKFPGAETHGGTVTAALCANATAPLYLFWDKDGKTLVSKYLNPADATDPTKACESGYPRLIGEAEEEGWSVLGNSFKVKSALTVTNAPEGERTYLFRDDAGLETTYVSSENYADTRFVKDLWLRRTGDGSIDSVDAAFVANNGWSFLFSGTQYIRYNDTTYAAMTDLMPKTTASDWAGVAGTVDAAFIYPANPTAGVANSGYYAYVISGGNYTKYTISEDGVPAQVPDSGVKALSEFAGEAGNYPDLTALQTETILALFTEEENDGSHTMYAYYRDAGSVVRRYTHNSGTQVVTDEVLATVDPDLAAALNIDMLTAVFRGIDGARYYFSGNQYTYTAGEGYAFASLALINSHFGKPGFTTFTNVETAFADGNGFYYFVNGTGNSAEYIKATFDSSGYLDGFVIAPGYPKLVSDFATNEPTLSATIPVTEKGDITLLPATGAYLQCDNGTYSLNKSAPQSQAGTMDRMAWKDGAVAFFDVGVDEKITDTYLISNDYYAKARTDADGSGTPELVSGYPKLLTEQNWATENIGPFPAEAEEEGNTVPPITTAFYNGSEVVWIRQIPENSVSAWGQVYNPLHESNAVTAAAHVAGKTYLFSNGLFLKYSDSLAYEGVAPAASFTQEPEVAAIAGNFPHSAHEGEFTALVKNSTTYSLFTPVMKLTVNNSGVVDPTATKLLKESVNCSYQMDTNTDKYYFIGEMMTIYDDIPPTPTLTIQPVKTLFDTFPEGVTAIAKAGVRTYVISDDYYMVFQPDLTPFTPASVKTETWKLALTVGESTISLFELSRFFRFKELSNRYNKTDNSILDYWMAAPDVAALHTVTGWEKVIPPVPTPPAEQEPPYLFGIVKINDVYDYQGIDSLYNAMVLNIYAERFRTAPQKLQTEIWENFYPAVDGQLKIVEPKDEIRADTSDTRAVAADAVFNMQLSNVSKKERETFLKEYYRKMLVENRDALVGISLKKRTEEVWDSIDAAHGLTGDPDPVAALDLRLAAKRTELEALTPESLEYRAKSAEVMTLERTFEQRTTVITTRDLYGHFLTDVLMSEEAETSYIKEGTLSMQLYFHRFLMGLEEKATDVYEKHSSGSYVCENGVFRKIMDGESVDSSERYRKTDDNGEFEGDLKQWWKWMKNYRVWEANRKVFMYPENYIRPELRDTKSPQFKELEKAILEGEITDDAVTTAYKTYLDDFSIVSKLDVCGGFVHTIDDGEEGAGEKRAVMFGRTKQEPHEFYYATGTIVDTGGSEEDYDLAWNAWEKLGIQISADTVYPVFAFNKMFVFWVEYRPGEKYISKAASGNNARKATEEDLQKDGTANDIWDSWEPIIYCSFYNLNKQWSVPQEIKNVFRDMQKSYCFWETREVDDQYIEFAKKNFEKGTKLQGLSVSVDEESRNIYLDVIPVTGKNHDALSYIVSDSLDIFINGESYKRKDSSLDYINNKIIGNLEQVIDNDKDGQPIVISDIQSLIKEWEVYPHDERNLPWYSFSGNGGSFLSVPGNVKINKNIKGPIDISVDIDAGFGDTYQADSETKDRITLFNTSSGDSIIHTFIESGTVGNEDYKSSYDNMMDWINEAPALTGHYELNLKNLNFYTTRDAHQGYLEDIVRFLQPFSTYSRGVFEHNNSVYLLDNNGQYRKYDNWLKAEQGAIDTVIPQILPSHVDELNDPWGDFRIHRFSGPHPSLKYPLDIQNVIKDDTYFYLVMGAHLKVKKSDSSLINELISVYSASSVNPEFISRDSVASGTYYTVELARKTLEYYNTLSDQGVTIPITEGMDFAYYWDNDIPGDPDAPTPIAAVTPELFRETAYTLILEECQDYLTSTLSALFVDDRGQLVVIAGDRFVYFDMAKKIWSKSGYFGEPAVVNTIDGFGVDGNGKPVFTTIHDGFVSGGKLYIVGANTSGMRKIYEYDAANNTVVQGTYLESKFDCSVSCDASVMGNNTVYVFSGDRYHRFANVDGETRWGFSTFGSKWTNNLLPTDAVTGITAAYYGMVSRDGHDNPESVILMSQDKYGLFSIRGDGTLARTDHTDYITDPWNSIEEDFSELDIAAEEICEAAFTVRNDAESHLFFIKSVEGVSKYIEYEGSYSFPFIDKFEKYDIFRLTTSTASSMEKKLFGGGLDRLLTRHTQEATQELPAFYKFGDSYSENSNDIIQYNSLYFRKIPNRGDAAIIDGIDFNGALSIYYWEIFYHIPFLIANRLNEQQRFEDAKKWYEFVFNPIQEQTANRNYWNFLPFYKSQEKWDNSQYHELPEFMANQGGQLNRYYNDPFDPHAIASIREIAYRKALVMAYIDSCIDWGDNLFRQYTRESINEARMLYVLAYDLLGAKPVSGGSMARSDDKRFEDISTEFGSATDTTSYLRMVNLENEPINLYKPNYEYDFNGDGKLEYKVREATFCTPNDTMILGNYFHLPENELFIKYWDRVEDRLFKIRHCQNIDGVKVPLPLFQPPIDPMAIVSALGSGGSLSQALASLNVKVPHYRFRFMAGKAKELAGRLNQLGGAMLSALEKKDAETLSVLRNTHEKEILELTKTIREQQLEDRNNTLGTLKLNKGSAEFRKSHYNALISEGLIPQEGLQLAGLITAQVLSNMANSTSLVGAALSLIPNLGSPFAVTFGGFQLKGSSEEISKSFSSLSSNASFAANMAAISAGHKRREQDWEFQRDLASKEVDQIKQQIAGAEIQIEIAKQEIKQVEKQMKHNESVNTFMTSKFTNKELYQWMSSKLSGLFYQSYQLALDLAKEAQQSFRFELGLKESEVNYLTSYYWDSQKKGLLAGEILMNDLDRMEKGYMDKNDRRFEVSKSVSLLELDPAALLELKKNRKCSFTLPEEIFALDFPSHYCRQIKSVSITIPAVVGPYQNANATLTQQSHYTLLEPDADSFDFFLDPEGADMTEHIRADWRGQQQIAISRGVNDSGMFQLNFQDERYLPYEGTGTHSTWKLELNSHRGSFDLSTLSDVIVKVEYTALQGGDSFGKEVEGKLDGTVSVETRLFNIAQQFGGEWNRYLQDTNTPLELTLYPEMFPGLEGNILNAYVVFEGESLTSGGALPINAPVSADGTPLTFNGIPADAKNISIAFEYEMTHRF